LERVFDRESVVPRKNVLMVW